jgi:hypothetical protein
MRSPNQNPRTVARTRKQIFSSMRALCGGRGESQRTRLPVTCPLAPSRRLPAHIVRVSRVAHLPQRSRVGDLSRWRRISHCGPGQRDVRKRGRILAGPGTQSGPAPRKPTGTICYVNCYVVSGLEPVSISFTAQLQRADRGKPASFELVVRWLHSGTHWKSGVGSRTLNSAPLYPAVRDEPLDLQVGVSTHS